jgi:hypothetical protein
MIEVKTSTCVKEHHRHDIAVQLSIATESGVPLALIEVAHINNAFTYFGGNYYEGLFEVVDFSQGGHMVSSGHTARCGQTFSIANYHEENPLDHRRPSGSSDPHNGGCLV